MGHVIRMSIDMSARNMHIFKRGEGKEEHVVTEALPERLSQKTLFFFISLRDYGDMIRLITPE